MLGFTGLRAGLIFIWKGMVLTSMEMAGFCSPCLAVIALVIWLRSLLRSGAGLCGRSRFMHWECRAMLLHVSPIVDLRQDQLAWVVWFLIFLFLPSCISMRRRSGSVAEVITGSSKFPVGVCRSRMSRSRS
ncbi:hypothetical protein A7X58_20230 [Stenotrophomonas maltophilia]|nr:hypothetical protein A7X58_20230 [Stenotrophomonas maltophilia]